MLSNRYRSRSFALNQLQPHNRGMFISVVFLGGVIATFLLAFVAFGNDIEDKTSSLQLVIILHRHGERTPTRLYAKDPYNDVERYWPIGLGQLTNVGKKQLYELGQIFARRYDSLISKYSANSIRVQSSDVDRTLMSAAALLAGWFPPQDDQLWCKDLKWQPIPIHTLPKSDDKIISLKAPCPRYSSEKDEVLKQFKKNETKAETEYFEYLSEHTGQKIDSIRDIETLYSCLFIEELNGLKLPDWTKQVYPHPMKEKASVSMATFAWNKVMQRLHGGNFVIEILKIFNDKIKGKLEEKKLYLFSGHDITISVIWRTFGFEEFILPSFGASLIWELHRDMQGYFVKMFYQNNTEQVEPYELRIPKCSSPCSLSTLYAITEDVRPIDWEKECQISESHKDSKSSHH